MGTWLRDRQFSAPCVAANMVGTMTVCPAWGNNVKRFEHDK